MTTADIAKPEMVREAKRGISTLAYARGVGIAFVVLAILFGGASFLILLGLTPIEPSQQVISIVLVINALFVSLLIYLVGREVFGLIRARKRGRAAARMHIRIVGLFGIVAAFPAIVVAIIAGITLDIGLDRIFDNRTRTIVDNSISVANSYVNDATVSLNAHTIGMGQFLNRNRSYFVVDRRGFENFMTGQVLQRGLYSASVVLQDGTRIAQSATPRRGVQPRVSVALLKTAADGKPACGVPTTRNLVSCAFKLSRFDQTAYLFATGYINPTVLNSIQLMKEITNEYETLESGRLSLQIAFALLYVGICLTILLSAIWMGIAVADRLVEPIRRLITAADQVAAGDLNVNVPASRSEGELKSLTETFNSMTRELSTQRDEILNNQEQIDRRRRFTEAVLSGVTAGVIGVSGEGRIAIANSSGFSLLGGQADELLGRQLIEVSPELYDVVQRAEVGGKGDYREQITIFKGGKDRTLNVQVSVDDGDQETHSHVITIDDITDLVSAQRTSAWADVARRIAHEIKNPLTPIQLSAERIRRRYGKKITEDRDVFDQCTETIIRQVADIGRMVDEFSSFARMPKPTMTVADIGEPIREAVFLLKVAHPEIEFDVALPDHPLPARFDGRLMSQAFGNLIKNATEAIEGVEFGENERPKITIRSETVFGNHVIEIIDNGKGLPKENRQRLLEPYMTTREKGTGLGLAIVGKILEEHSGRIELLDAPSVASGGRGAMIRISLPVQEAASLEANNQSAGAEQKTEGNSDGV